MKRLSLVFLDFLSIPGLFLNKTDNTKYHLKHICPRCPDWRRKMRQVEDEENCFWYSNWEKERYNIPRTFGIKNWVRQYIFLKTDLSRLKK